MHAVVCVCVSYSSMQFSKNGGENTKTIEYVEVRNTLMLNTH